jgi:hypothetical protein
MKAVFSKSQEYDIELLWWATRRLRSLGDIEDLGPTSRHLGLEESFLKKLVLADDFEDVRTLTETTVGEIHENLEADIDKAILDYQTAWDRINERFFKGVEGITDHLWFFEEYQVVVSPIHRGIGNRDNNIVSVSAFEEPADILRTVAHKILMIHIWNIIDNRYAGTTQDRFGHLWALNELATTAILGLEPSIDELWSERTRGYDAYLANYPQLKELQASLKDDYLRKSDFSGFLDAAYDRIELDYKGKSLA